jgi:beta-phosphoglucomutase
LPTTLHPLKAVIFDCDGVLVDSEPLHYRAFQEVLEPLGLGYDYDRYLESYIGFDDRDGFMEAFKAARRPLEAAELKSLVRAKGEAFRRIVSRGLASFPGVVDLVRDLAAHEVPLAISSGALRSEIAMFLEALGLSTAFRTVVAADDVEKSKPDPETYRVALERLKAACRLEVPSTRQVVAIEDTPTGIQSAKGAGLFVVAVTHSYEAAALQEADFVTDHLADLDATAIAGLLEHRSEAPADGA